MFGFLIKKNFCDGWDNLLSVVVTNIIFLAVTVGLVYLNLFASSTQSIIIKAVAFMLSAVILSILIFAYGDMAAEIANFNGVSLADYFRAIPGVLKDASLFGLLISVVFLISRVAVNYYFFQMQTIIGVMLGALILWLDLIFYVALMWFLPLRSLMHNDFKKCLKKCFIIFFDNTGFTIAVLIYDIVLLAFTVLFMAIVPSMSGLVIANTNALRLRLYKYDYLEEHPELQTKKERRKIPWEELIYDDRETLGPRKWKSFLFPWKD